VRAVLTARAAHFTIKILLPRDTVRRRGLLPETAAMKLEDTLFRGAALRTPMERAIPPKIYAQFPFLRKSICV